MFIKNGDDNGKLGGAGMNHVVYADELLQYYVSLVSTIIVDAVLDFGLFWATTHERLPYLYWNQ